MHNPASILKADFLGTRQEYITITEACMDKRRSHPASCQCFSEAKTSRTVCFIRAVLSCGIALDWHLHGQHGDPDQLHHVHPQKPVLHRDHSISYEVRKGPELPASCQHGDERGAQLAPDCLR